MGKLFMFIATCWVIVGLAGGVVEGNISYATTVLTENIDKDDTSLPVRSTNGFAEDGIVVIGTERIAYSDTSATSFDGSITQPMVRGAQNTTAQAHLTGDRVRTLESGMMNQSAQYNITVIQDTSGPQAFVTIPLAGLRLIGSYLKPPMQFLGTDLQILVYFWWALLAGTVIAIGLYLAGSRRI